MSEDSEVMIYSNREYLAIMKGDNWIQQYIRGAEFVKAILPDQNRYYHFDRLGTTQKITGDDESAIASYEVGDWGQVSPGGLVDNPFVYIGTSGYWFEGQLADPLYQIRARWLRPSTSICLSHDSMPDELAYRYVSNRPIVAIDPAGTYVVLVPGGQGHGTTWRSFPAYLQKTYKEAPLVAYYNWSVGGLFPPPIPPNEEIVEDVLYKIYNWSKTKPQTGESHVIRMYGHSYGSHVVGQIANPPSDYINKYKQVIEKQFCVKFTNYVTAVGWASAYPQHFTNINANLYCFAADPALSYLTQFVPGENIFWWMPQYYNTRGLLGGQVQSSDIGIVVDHDAPAWHPGGKDHLGPTFWLDYILSSNKKMRMGYGSSPYYWSHTSFDSQQGLSSIDGPLTKQAMMKFVAGFLM